MKRYIFTCPRCQTVRTFDYKETVDSSLQTRLERFAPGTWPNRPGTGITPLLDAACPRCGAVCGWVEVVHRPATAKRHENCSTDCLTATGAVCVCQECGGRRHGEAHIQHDAAKAA